MGDFMTDIEIARNSKKKNIKTIAKSIGLSSKDLVLYGDDKAKIPILDSKKKGELILVTAISPTPFGEGKTTVSIGLADALKKLNKKTIVALREPSMGPVFGMKGGATGGGYSQVVPMDEINLHFTGDFHAITSANNLICAAVDSHIYFGNELKIKEVLFHRCLDVNDRALREVSLENRKELFSITSASEIMALFCLANSLDDLKRRLGNIVIGVNEKGNYVYAKDLKLEGSLLALLKDAFKPNLVQTLEHTPAIIHGGPFANIAHGCNSIVATKTALSLADYVVTEAGFGAELGAEKFFDIKCRKGGLKPSTTVLVCTIKALKYHGGVDKNKIFVENVEAMKKGFANLDRHYNNLKKYGVSVIVCLNEYGTDTKKEKEAFCKYCEEKGYQYAISNAYAKGGKGAIKLAEKVLTSSTNKFKLLYADNISIEEKINIICQNIYGAKKVVYPDSIKKIIKNLERNKLSHLPICVAKTQYSFSDDKNKLGAPENFEVTIKDVRLYNGAEFITVLLGDIMVMPGLSRKPNYEIIDVIDGEIINLS